LQIVDGQLERQVLDDAGVLVNGVERRAELHSVGFVQHDGGVLGLSVLGQVENPREALLITISVSIIESICGLGIRLTDES